MGFAGLSDDAEGPEAVSTYKASSVRSIIERCFVRCKNLLGLLPTYKNRCERGQKNHVKSTT